MAAIASILTTESTKAMLVVSGSEACQIDPSISTPPTLLFNNTYRRLDVGADATDASADSPGRDGPKELDSKPLLLGPGLWMGLSMLATSGKAPENCDEVEDAPVAASVAG